MKLKYNQPKGRRYETGKIWCQKNGKVFRTRLFIWVNCTTPGWWWSRTKQQWVPIEDDTASSNCMNGINSVKSFRSHLKQWSKYLPAGLEFELVSRWDRFCVRGKTKLY